MAVATLLTGPALVIAGILSAASAAWQGVADAPDSAMAQQADSASVLLSAVAGIDPVACQLILNALDNRWNAWGMRPSSMLYGPRDDKAGGVAAWAQRDEPDATEVQAFMEGLSARDGCVQSVSARMLGRLDDRDTTARLIIAARDAGSPGRRASMVALGHIGSPDALPVLVDALGDTDPAVRYTAAVALGEIENSDAIPALAAALASDSDVEVRRAVTWALGRIE